MPVPPSRRKSDMDIRTVATKVLRKVHESRANEMLSLAWTTAGRRHMDICRALTTLSPGAYLLGAGPYSAGIYRVSTCELTIGRQPTPVEDYGLGVIDVEIRDNLSFAPRDASRLHARVFKVEDGAYTRFFLEDAGSSRGTYLNYEKLESGRSESDGIPGPAARELTSGDYIETGSQGINVFVFYVKGELDV